MQCPQSPAIPVSTRKTREVRTSYSDPRAVATVSRALQDLAPPQDWERAAVVCVGTDRSTGDALGPLVGTFLVEQSVPVAVYGTLERPVHATNLLEVLPKIASHPFVLAVDAALGRPESIGQIVVKAEPLRPGSGVSKQLVPIGDACVMGMVNVGGFLEVWVLQNTSLFVVWLLACVIASAIARAVHDTTGRQIHQGAPPCAHALVVSVR